MYRYPLPSGTANAVDRSPKAKHPGLLMDMFTPHTDAEFKAFDQEMGQKTHLEAIVAAAESFGEAYGADLLSRWSGISAAADETWDLTTVWRLASHLSRPTALENAALSLHPIYGFPHLPGSGLKGLALACAKSRAERRDYERILGTTASGGQVVFLEAWPKTWPKLEIDITNNHHSSYYTPNPGTGRSAPGDWESPKPVYFLTVAPRTTFRFALGKAHSRVPDSEVTTASEWLVGGLTELGFGAKTAAGYGYFLSPDEGAESIRTGTDGDPGDRFEVWIGRVKGRNDVGSAVRNELPSMLAALPPSEHQRAKEQLLNALGAVCDDLEKKGKKGKPSLAEWIRQCNPQKPA